LEPIPANPDKLAVLLRNCEDNNPFTLAKWAPIWLQNAALNYSHIERSKHFGLLNGKHAGRVALVFGTGPGLDANIEVLERYRGMLRFLILICGPSSYKPLLDAGIVPNYMVALDASPLTPRYYAGCDTEQTTLITTPCIDWRVIREWKGEQFYFIGLAPTELQKQIRELAVSIHADTIEAAQVALDTATPDVQRLINAIEYGVQCEGVNYSLQQMYPYLWRMVNLGCVVNTEANCAVEMGCNQVYLCGTDFAFSGGRFRAGSTLTPEQAADEIAQRAVVTQPDVNGGETQCWLEHILYRTALMGWLQNTQARIPELSVVNCTGSGILTGLPQRPLEEVLEELREGFLRR